MAELIRVQKCLAQLGLGSRREVERWMAAGRVAVNGKVIDLGAKVGEGDSISLDGKKVWPLPKGVEAAEHEILLYHKPIGQICTQHDPEGRKTVFEYLPPPKQGKWIMVGRLDINTSGLLLFTTDGELANRMMHPRYQLTRTYAVRVIGSLTREQLLAMSAGVMLEDGMARFDTIVARKCRGENKWYDVSLHEGRNREVRRLFESQGCQVNRLIRTQYGPYYLNDLEKGKWQIKTL